MLQKLSRSTLLFAFTFSSALSQFTWKDCGSPQGRIDSITANPAVPRKGSKFEIKGSGVVLKAAKAVKLDIELIDLPIVGTVKLQKDACEPLEISYPVLGGVSFAGLPCPLTANQAIELSAEVNLGYFTPDGTYTSRVVASDEAGNKLMCLETTVVIGGGKYVEAGFVRQPATSRFLNAELGQAPVAPVTQFEERNIDQVKAALADILAKLQNAQGRTIDNRQSDCICFRNYSPVCEAGSGRRYSNECMARCAGAYNTYPC